MSVHAISWVLKHSAAEGTNRLCLLVLANYADEEGLAWPGVSRIAREMRVSERTAQRAIRSLAAGGHVEVVPQGAPDSRIRADRRPNAYRLRTRGDDSVTPHGVTPDAPRGDNQRADGVTPLSPEPSVEPSEEKPSATLRDGFDEFWATYPKRGGRKVGKKAALDQWTRRRLAHERERVIYAAGIYAEAVEQGVTIAKDAERFLKSDYWRDWCEGVPVAGEPSAPVLPLVLGCDECDQGWIDTPAGMVPCSACRGQTGRKEGLTA